MPRKGPSKVKIHVSYRRDQIAQADVIAERECEGNRAQAIRKLVDEALAARRVASMTGREVAERSGVAA